MIVLLVFTICIRCNTSDRTENKLSVSGEVEKAHKELWGRFIDKHGVINDFKGALPTPEDCSMGRPNALGWWSPIENGPMFTGIYLTA
jgi:hypothetical protein